MSGHRHCLHRKIAGVLIPPGTLVCCTCRAEVQAMPLLWDGDYA